MSKRTHCQRVLDLLRDGEPHSHLELYALGTVAHSRISDLRKRGYVIEQWRDGDLYLYRLVSEPSLCEVESRPPAAADSASQSEVAPRANGSPRASSPEEASSLTLFEPPPVRRELAWR